MVSGAAIVLVRRAGALLAVFAIFMAVFVWQLVEPVRQAQVQVGIGAKTHFLEVAATPESRQKGLSGRDWLTAGAGMVFVFSTPGTYCFWMQDTRFPLDMIWLNDKQRVVHIERYVQPNSYPEKFCPPASALYVVEVAAGVTDDTVQVGDELTLSAEWR